MSRRSDQLKNFLEPIQPAAAAAESATPRAKPTVQSGALNSMNQAIANLATEAEEADRLRAQIEGGETIVELEPVVVDAGPAPSSNAGLVVPALLLLGVIAAVASDDDDS